MLENTRWSINKISRSAVYLFVSIVIAVFMPLTALAEESTDTPPAEETTTQATEEETPAVEETPASQTTGPTEPTGPQQPTGPTGPIGPTTTPGPIQPNGAGSTTFVYNESTGKWENDYYIWDPVTKQTTPKTPQQYSYNPQTGRWDSKDWIYNPAINQYVENTPANRAAIEKLGPNSTNGLSVTDNASGAFNNFYDASISTRLFSGAYSGDANVSGNTIGGSAATGNALVVSNLFNLLQSSSNILGGNFTTFSQDIQGDVVGDILINPDAIMAGGVTNATSNTDLTVNEKGSGLIANDVTLDAQSGNASVTGNNTAGDATTGNADAVANIVNAINSYIGAGQGFLGMVNIHGNLDGDILLPPDVLEKLIASNGMEIELSKNTNLSADITSNQAIENDITTTASTGAANVSDNTSAGSASTGDASTKLTVLNLTGREVIGELG
jgi:hypothetical protein